MRRLNAKTPDRAAAEEDAPQSAGPAAVQASPLQDLLQPGLLQPGNDEGTLVHEGKLGSIADVVVNGSAPAVKKAAQDWADLCRRDLRQGLLTALSTCLELAGLPIGSLQAADLEADPKAFLERLPDYAKDQSLDLGTYPLSPQMRHGRRSVSNFERFWALGLGAQDPVVLLDSRLIAALSRWLLALPTASIRSVRHAATVSALASAEALGHHHQALQQRHDTLQRQLGAAAGRRGAAGRQEAQLKRDAAAAAARTEEMRRVRTQLLEQTVPPRSRDVSETIRLYTLSEVERLMKADPEMYLQNKWAVRVFLMIHDPAPEVRMKAVSVIHQWYASPGKRSEAVQEHLNNFAQRCLSHLVERIGDVDARVASAALRCLRLPALAERLEDEEFDSIVNLCIGSVEPAVREEAALFINSHVFQDPGICVLPGQAPRRRARGQEQVDRPVPIGGAMEGEGGAPPEEPRAADTVKELYNSETSLSMLVEYLENYVGDHLRLAERAVGAFWNRAPALSHWGTMVNLCLVGESQRGPSMDPISPRQRLALLFILEAAVRRAEEDLRAAKPGERDAAAVKLNEACAHILPELPRLFEICRPEEHHSLLISHVAKVLIEYAVENSQNQVLVNAKALCASLRKAIEHQTPLDTVKYCTDALLALARCFGEAKATFLELSKDVHHRCAELLKPGAFEEQPEETKRVMSRFMVLSNRGIDMTFGNIGLLQRIISLLESRASWMKENLLADALKAPDGEAAEPKEPAASPPDGEAAAPEGEAAAEEEGGEAKVAEPPLPPSVPGAQLMLQLLEAAAIAVMWHARMAFWVESNTGAGKEGDKGLGAEAQVSEMLQGFGELPALRAQLPAATAGLRAACAGLMTSDRSPFVRFHGFCSYMCMLQLAVGVSERLSLEMGPDGKAPLPSGWGGTFEVEIPEDHVKALWHYLNGFYIRLTGADAEGVTFSAEGHKVATADVYPAPSLGTVTSVRFLTQKCMEPSGDAEKREVGREVDLLLAVLASRAVLESELEDVYAGPLGLLLLTQCERSRPKPLREVALGLLKRLRELARTNEEFAIQFYRMQEEAISGLFECAGLEAAQALSSVFTRQWGPRMLPWLERAFAVVLDEAAASCVTADKKRLPLLEVYSTWVKPDFVADYRRREIAADIVRLCAAAGFNAEDDPHVAKFLQRALPRSGGGPAPETMPEEEDEELEIVGGPEAAQGTPLGAAEAPSHRVSGKRAPEERPTPAADENPSTSKRRAVKTPESTQG